MLWILPVNYCIKTSKTLLEPVIIKLWNGICWCVKRKCICQFWNGKSLGLLYIYIQRQLFYIVLTLFSLHLVVLKGRFIVFPLMTCTSACPEPSLFHSTGLSPWQLPSRTSFPSISHSLLDFHSWLTTATMKEPGRRYGNCVSVLSWL